MLLAPLLLTFLSFACGAQFTRVVLRRRVECGYSDAGRAVAFVIYDGPGHITHALVPISIARTYAERLAGKKQLPKHIEIVEERRPSSPYRGEALNVRPSEYKVPHWAVRHIAKWLLKELPKLRELAA